MNDCNCDFTPMEQVLKEDIRQVITVLQNSLDEMGKENYCLLGNFENVKDKFSDIEVKAATFYLNCYLAPYTDKYPEISICAQKLSNKRHGGLIVIQREDSLSSLIQPGITINAELTHSLLESIFYPGNPLHDGAVLVNQNHIKSAANVLPLTNKSIGDQKKLGTRHRAAIGLSEQSDALVLVISEETGRVSFALNGELYPISI
ncbi:sporulation-specific diadenylate cyclase CdaS [Rummeliibacillus sp. NPDC094406]|uniref:sporulation-specific diadenylate cyclase CdaS n=1 Tax=Rummeliibacillus sp. NPDC094406 TaxID=3364511 RepID=UPI00382500AA